MTLISQVSQPFKDRFGNLAQQYARSRVRYPSELMLYLSEQCASRRLALDVGCGSGQVGIYHSIL
jgi:SAM-dependent methyltransferase